ncbi:MAG TPA: hypothetical protein VJL89_00550 [Thermodesulfovibrionia bacterium]|nr:hypothetical protein [Thermodesulfovibrionia bacterium]
MLITALERERQALWEKAMEKGMEEGMKEGMKKTGLDVAKNMLIRGTDIGFISEVTGLSEEVVKQLQV